MSNEIFEYIGVFVVALLGYALGSGIAGIVLGIDSTGNASYVPHIGWAAGAIIYATTVLMMRYVC